MNKNQVFGIFLHKNVNKISFFYQNVLPLQHLYKEQQTQN